MFFPSGLSFIALIAFARFITIHFRHHDIHQDYIKCAFRMISENLNSILSIHNSFYIHPELFQLHGSNLCIQFIILCKKDIHTCKILPFQKNLCLTYYIPYL